MNKTINERNTRYKEDERSGGSARNDAMETRSMIADIVARFDQVNKQKQTPSEIRGVPSEPSSCEPSYKGAKDFKTVIDPSWLGTPPAEFEELKANFLTFHAGRPTQTILFASTDNGDGASSIATNFASAMAQVRDLKILLVDANLRNPSLHKSIAIDHVYSLATLLDEAVPGQIEFVFEPGHVTVLRTGGVYNDPLSVFATQKFTEILEDMRRRFNFIVFDGPPVFRSSESLFLASKFDATILVLRSEKTRKQIAYRAIQKVEAAGGKVMGTVLNRRKFHIPRWLYERL